MATTKKKAGRRTTLRTSKGTKLYAVRAADGTFEDIQTYKRAHAADLRKASTAEAAKRKPAAKKASKAKTAKRKTTARKTTTRR